ncbi:hypothetical protein EZV62_015287 [Acer yangbiense]|uniref:Uncharacterized protein n=1 Tax=Acer yangbiense TaxID=1000413 RepID=A0A5C7HKS9_9ROSI|nr:hypothetical protein EZV62_015287 [Acer yangbiense]
MQEQQHKQLDLNLAIGKTGKLLESRREPSQEQVTLDKSKLADGKTHETQGREDRRYCSVKASEQKGTVDQRPSISSPASWLGLVAKLSETGERWVQKRLMKLYIDCCNELCEPPNMKLLKRLYVSEVEDEVIVSDCELQGISITLLLNALHANKTVAMLDLSHNLLGNGTMEKLQQFFTTSSQKYGDPTLDLRCNRFGPLLCFRLEVLNLSGNHLTDACGSYLSTMLENCKALYNLNIERCSITSRTIQKVSDALGAESALAQLSIGYNNPITGNAVMNLLAKLATLKRAESEWCKKLRKPVDGALQLIDSWFSRDLESVKLDLSYCGLTSTCVHKFNADVSLARGIDELNLGGNPIMQELGLAGVLKLVQALTENDTLEELNLADNADLDKQGISKEADTDEHDLCPMNTDCNQLEVADSEDDKIRVEAAASGFDNSCTSLCQKNSSFECQFIQELSTAIGRAKHLQLLDLSNNGFSTQDKVFGLAGLTETVYDGVKNVALSALNGINVLGKEVAAYPIEIQSLLEYCSTHLVGMHRLPSYEVARLEAELRTPDPSREKDLKIQQMEMETEELRRQRDMAQCQVDELRRKLQDDLQVSNPIELPCPSVKKKCLSYSDALSPKLDSKELGRGDRTRKTMLRQSVRQSSAAPFTVMHEICKLEHLQEALGEEANRALKSVSANLKEEITRLHSQGSTIANLEEQLESVQKSIDKPVMSLPSDNQHRDTEAIPKAKNQSKKRKLLPLASSNVSLRKTKSEEGGDVSSKEASAGYRCSSSVNMKKMFQIAAEENVLEMEANEVTGYNLEDDEIAIETEEPQVSWPITFRAEATDN